jgi:hypothetical protein
MCRLRGLIPMNYLAMKNRLKKKGLGHENACLAAFAPERTLRLRRGKTPKRTKGQ